MPIVDLCVFDGHPDISGSIIQGMMQRYLRLWIAASLIATFIPHTTQAYYDYYAPYGSSNWQLRQVNENLQGIRRSLDEAETHRLQDEFNRVMREASEVMSNTPSDYCPEGYKQGNTEDIDSEIRRFKEQFRSEFSSAGRDRVKQAQRRKEVSDEIYQLQQERKYR